MGTTYSQPYFSTKAAFIKTDKMEFYFAVLAQYKAPTVYARDSLLLYGTPPSRKA